MLTKVTRLTCKRCGHTWWPRQPEVRICPKCKSAFWDKDRKTAAYSVESDK